MKVEPVAWDLAKNVAFKAISYSTVSVSRDQLDDMQAEFSLLGKNAEKIVKKETGLKPAGSAVCKVVDRKGWVEANLTSFRRLLSLAQDRFTDSLIFRKALNPATSVAAGIELGLMLSWMSTKVLGQYDIAVGATGEGDSVYFVAENILSVEKEYNFDKEQFRLWIAIHELTHRAQFKGVGWMSDYFESLIKRSVDLAAFTPKDLIAGMRRSISEISAGNNPLAEHGLVGLFVSGEQMNTLKQAQALMSILEGHADVVMDRAATEAVKDADLFSKTLHARRQASGHINKFVRQATGMEAKAAQYKQGEQFIYHIESAIGKKVMDKIWSSSEMLPNMDEISHPDLWVERAGGK